MGFTTDLQDTYACCVKLQQKESLGRHALLPLLIILALSGLSIVPAVIREITRPVVVAARHARDGHAGPETAVLGRGRQGD